MTRIKILSESTKDDQTINFIKMASICILNDICKLHYSDGKIENIHLYNDHIYFNFLTDNNNKNILESYFLMFACNYLSKIQDKDYSDILSRILRDKLRGVDNV